MARAKTRSVTKTREAKMVGTKLSPYEYEKLHKLVEAGMYLNVSDFVRDAIREKLEGIEVIKVRDVNYRTAKKEVLGYFKKYGEAYPNEAADDLELDFELVCNVVDDLKKEGRLEVID